MRRAAHRTVVVLLVVALAIGAGCAASLTDEGSQTATDAGSATATSGSTATGGTAGTATGTSTAAAETAGTPDSTRTTTGERYPNPWGKRLVTVGLDPDGAQQGDASALVKETVDWWNDGRIDRYATYPVRFTYVGPTTDADVVVRFVEELNACGETWREGEFLGCASLLGPNTVPNDPAVVQVRAGFKRENTLTTLQHEFGHLLGLRHGDDPRFVMNESHVAYTLAQPNATEVAFPWESRNLTVFLANDAGAGHRQQVEHALAFFERGADGTLNVTPRFSFAADREAADVVIELYDSSLETDAITGDGSVGSVLGYDDDGDGALEYYTDATITVAGIESDATGWHVAYWLATALGYTEAELPDALVDASYEDRRSQWWQ